MWLLTNVLDVRAEDRISNLFYSAQRQVGPEQDALRPGIRLFLELHPQKVADLGSDFGLVGFQNLVLELGTRMAVKLGCFAIRLYSGGV